MSEAINKAYAVECSAGGWDDYRTWICGIFTNTEDAEKLKVQLNKKAKQVKDDCPIQGDVDLLNDEESLQYSDYYFKNQTWMDFNEAKVKEYPLNKAIDF